MSSGAPLEMEWAALNSAQGEAESLPMRAANGAAHPTDSQGAAGASAHLTDEEILGLESHGPAELQNAAATLDSELSAPLANAVGEAAARRSGQAEVEDPGNAGAYPSGAAMPAWMQAAAADPQHGPEATALWREHQEFRAAFASPEEARAVKELLPGGVRDVLSLREATQSVERIDAALFSGDVRAQAEVVAELARANPAAFRSLFAEAAKVIADPAASRTGFSLSDFGPGRTGFSLSSDNRRGESSYSQAGNSQNAQAEARATDARAPQTAASQAFDASAYATFERGTNEAVARDVRGAIGETLQRVLPEGVADGAARRIGEDIFQEIHRALAADRALSEQVAAALQSRRFGSVEQQHVAALLAGRAKQLVPGVARRVIGEWTSSVLNTSRNKAARQAAAAARVDIAAAGGSRDSMPMRQAAQPRVDYAAMSDDQILGL